MPITEWIGPGPWLERMEALVREYDQANPDGWPAHANFVLGGYVSLLESSRRHAEGETVLKRFLEKPANAGQESWLRERMVDLYASAIEAQSRVSLGEGDELLSNVVEHVMKRVENGDQNLRYQLLYRLIRIFQGTQAKKLKSCPREVRRFAFEALPEVLETQTRNYRRLVERTDGVVEEVIGPREALAFLLDRIESWPGRLEYSYDNAWRRFGSRLGTLRQRTGDLKELEPRLLKLVVAALRRDLTTLYAQSRSVYYWNSTFWEQKADVFLQVAEEILAEHDDSERFVMHIAYYVYHGLRQYDRAIEILLTAHQKKLLGPQSRTTLVSWLHEQQEFGQSIALLETLIEEQPELMTHRVRLMTAYHRTDQPRRLRTLLDQIDDFFRQKGRWTERNISALMIGCESAGLNEDVIKYAGELIPLHQRTRRNRGIGSSVLYDYYRHKALAHSALGQTTEAVDAAAGAVVSWGPRHDQRGQAIEALTTIIGKARDLDGYVAQRDRATGRSRRDSPVIRLAIARAYMEKGQLDKAIVQLKITVELQPTNREAHQALLECFSNREDTQAAVKQLLAMIDFDRHNLALYNDLAARVKDDESMAERAATAIVEAAPAEAEHHTSLAKLREGQQRWDAAILHWNHAAELRALEPDGLFGLVEAQIKAKRWKEAERTLARLARKEWPSRFGDVTSRIRELRSTVERQLRD